MKNLIIKQVVKVNLDLTAEQWQLRNPSEAEAIAWCLNMNIEDYVNRGETRATTVLFTQRLMASMEEQGAFDPPPLAVLEQVMDRIYGRKKNDIT